jgi:hypothetical protein
MACIPTPLYINTSLFITTYDLLLQLLRKVSYLTKQILFQAGMYGIREFTKKQASDYADRNSGNIERDAKASSSSLIDSNYEQPAKYRRVIFDSSVEAMLMHGLAFYTLVYYLGSVEIIVL